MNGKEIIIISTIAYFLSNAIMLPFVYLLGEGISTWHAVVYGTGSYIIVYMLLYQVYGAYRYFKKIYNKRASVCKNKNT